MKKLLLIILSFFILITVASASLDHDGNLVMQDEVIQVPLAHRVRSHPDAINMGEGWYRVEIKENLSGTAFDWRFDVRRIDSHRGAVYITHRMEQISVNAPRSSWVIIHRFVDKGGNGTLNNFEQGRFISIKDRSTKDSPAEEDLWLIVMPMWPDKFRYPKLEQSEILELYKKEMEYWENKL